MGFSTAFPRKRCCTGMSYKMLGKISIPGYKSENERRKLEKEISRNSPSPGVNTFQYPTFPCMCPCWRNLRLRDYKTLDKVLPEGKSAYLGHERTKICSRTSPSLALSKRKQRNESHFNRFRFLWNVFFFFQI